MCETAIVERKCQILARETVRLDHGCTAADLQIRRHVLSGTSIEVRLALSMCGRQESQAGSCQERDASPVEDCGFRVRDHGRLSWVLGRRGELVPRKLGRARRQTSGASQAVSSALRQCATGSFTGFENKSAT